MDLIRGIDSPRVSYLYCAPHTFHLGGDIRGMLRHAGALVTQVHLGDTLDHRASSGLRYIVNPPGSPVRVHQHLDIGQGEVDFEALFSGLHEIGFDGILTTCVFAWEERAHDSARSCGRHRRAAWRATSPERRAGAPPLTRPAAARYARLARWPATSDSRVSVAVEELVLLDDEPALVADLAERRRLPPAMSASPAPERAEDAVVERRREVGAALRDRAQDARVGSP